MRYDVAVMKIICAQRVSLLQKTVDDVAIVPGRDDCITGWHPNDMQFLPRDGTRRRKVEVQFFCRRKIEEQMRFMQGFLR